MAKRGRPRKSDPYAVGGSETARRRGLRQISVYVSVDEDRQLAIAAAAAGLPKSHFVRDAALAASTTYGQKRGPKQKKT